MTAKPKVGLDRSKTGRAKGTPNKITALLEDAIIEPQAGALTVRRRGSSQSRAHRASRTS